MTGDEKPGLARDGDLRLIYSHGSVYRGIIAALKTFNNEVANPRYGIINLSNGINNDERCVDP
jgi:hypothetical protein